MGLRSVTAWRCSVLSTLTTLAPSATSAGEALFYSQNIRRCIHFVLLINVRPSYPFREVRQNQGKEVRVKVVRNWSEDHPASAEVVIVKLVSYLDPFMIKTISIATVQRYIVCFDQFEFALLWGSYLDQSITIDRHRESGVAGVSWGATLFRCRSQTQSDE